MKLVIDDPLAGVIEASERFRKQTEDMVQGVPTPLGQQHGSNAIEFHGVSREADESLLEATRAAEVEEMWSGAVDVDLDMLRVVFMA